MAKVYTLEEVSKHNVFTDCWLLIGGKVYDVTKFMDDHPGGDDVLISASGKDATDDFEDVGHSSIARQMMREYYIGDIDASTVPRRRIYQVPTQPDAIKEEDGEIEQDIEQAIPYEIRKKIEEAFDKLENELEESKKLVKKLQQKLCCIEFEFEELKKATNNFAETLKVGEGTFGAVYKGILRYTQVAIKKLKFKDERGFNEEIETLSKVRHPNLVTLIGACRDNENPALVYEYLPHGSLEDHLNCKNNTSPLSGQTRVRIALEICSALCFLHSTLRSHGDLKPDNVLLDSNYVSKLSDFGTCRQLNFTTGTMAMTAAPYYQTENVIGTFAYMDPEYLASGVMTPRFDVYSFGLVLLRLATGKDLRVVTDKTRMGIIEAVKTAIDDVTFDKLIDASIEWPTKEMPEKMAKLGLRCFKKKKKRPNLAEVFESLKVIASNNDTNLY